MSTRLSEPASLMNMDLSPRCRLTALRSSEGWSWQVTGNPISWQGAVKLTYNAQPIPWRTPPRLGDKDGTPTMRPCGSFPRLPVVIRHWCNSRFTSVPVHPQKPIGILETLPARRVNASPTRLVASDPSQSHFERIRHTAPECSDAEQCRSSIENPKSSLSAARAPSEAAHPK